ncbi:MAG: creatininase family protein [Chloroflexota bacterium]|nr:creatininase family protein [Chloroflexota bacterium]
MKRKVRWEEMFPDELDAALERRPVVYLAYGLCEPHGLHNAVGLDALKAHAIACLAAEEHGGIVAPPSYWHVHESGYHAAWAHRSVGDRNPWLTSLPPWVLFKTVFYQLRAVDARGFQAALILTGHYGGNEHDFRRVAEVYMRHRPLRIWAGADWETIEYEDCGGDHAGRCETSQLWALRPDLVDMSRLASDRTMATGSDAGQSSRRDGERIVASQVSWLGRKAGELLSQYAPPASPGTPVPGNPLGGLTFEETERIWRDEVEPILPELRCMNLYPGQSPVDPSSPWAGSESTRGPG